jgi:hypothetical protein
MGIDEFNYVARLFAIHIRLRRIAARVFHFAQRRADLPQNAPVRFDVGGEFLFSYRQMHFQKVTKVHLDPFGYGSFKSFAQRRLWQFGANALYGRANFVVQANRIFAVIQRHRRLQKERRVSVGARAL